MQKYVIGSLAIILLTVLTGYYSIFSQKNYVLGLDLAGGTELTYQADTSELAEQEEIDDAMSALRDVIERRVNVFGVSEPVVQVESTRNAERLIVELPGVTDVEEAVAALGETPVLEFRLLSNSVGEKATINEDGVLDVNIEDVFEPSGLSGKQIESASVQFGNQTHAQAGAYVLVTFNDEGKELLARITREHIGEPMAIYLDGVAISTPVIQDEIPNGQATISGSFTPEEARELARNLNLGALPVPIELINTQTVGPSLGSDVLNSGIQAGIYGLIIVVIFLIIWYRLPGLIASVALLSYILLMLSVFKFIPVTLTAAGIAGFILTIGMAVDANVLVFERMKEEIRRGKTIYGAIQEGFSRAWPSIRDANISSLITAVILFWFGTSLIKGFALVFGIGVIFSMLSAIVITRTLLYVFTVGEVGKIRRKLFNSGLK